MAICELRDTSKHYGSDATLVRALDEVSLTFEPGEFTVISGPSGSGKTTLLNMVGCLDVPTEGTVLIEGHDVSRLSSRALARIRGNRIGFIFQSFNLIPVLTAVENVELALQLAGHNGNRHKKARELLAAVGLGEMTRRRPNQLSGGQQQRVAVARALVKDPALVIADEPTANLDTENGRQVLDIMRKMNAERGVTFLFSTHEKLVIDMARRVVTLRDGRVVSDVAQNAGEA
ncbi:MAG: ABC transporter ATP-binding protein [Deltaproteobacteria bacterium]|nr:ABC transporter ATP-binding protein [Deltaproteobacteria bacterium]